jgi:hypothetical protein
MEWTVEETIGNWWRPNFEPPQVCVHSRESKEGRKGGRKSYFNSLFLLSNFV